MVITEPGRPTLSTSLGISCLIERAFGFGVITVFADVIEKAKKIPHRNQFGKHGSNGNALDV